MKCFQTPHFANSLDYFIYDISLFSISHRLYFELSSMSDPISFSIHLIALSARLSFAIQIDSTLIFSSLLLYTFASICGTNKWLLLVLLLLLLLLLLLFNISHNCQEGGRKTQTQSVCNRLSKTTKSNLQACMFIKWRSSPVHRTESTKLSYFNYDVLNQINLHFCKCLFN